jgi:hypothetical protein
LLLDKPKTKKQISDFLKWKEKKRESDAARRCRKAIIKLKELNNVIK